MGAEVSRDGDRPDDRLREARRPSQRRREPPPPLVLTPTLFQRRHHRPKIYKSDLHLMGMSSRRLLHSYFSTKGLGSVVCVQQPDQDTYMETKFSPADCDEHGSAGMNAMLHFGSCARLEQPSVDEHDSNLDGLVDFSFGIEKSGMLNSTLCYSFDHSGVSLFAHGATPHNLDLTQTKTQFGLRYNRDNFSSGLTINPMKLSNQAWCLHRFHRLAIGAEAKFDWLNQTIPNGEVVVSVFDAPGSTEDTNRPRMMSYECSARINLDRDKGSAFTLSYYQQMMFKRRIMNPFETREVNEIHNFVNIGAQVKQLANGGGIEPALALALQANRGLLVKGRLQRDGVSLCVATKIDKTPVVTLAGTVTWPFASFSALPRPALSLIIESDGHSDAGGHGENGARNHGSNNGHADSHRSYGTTSTR
mmetsp:Transcript_17804/g.42381  ORF Transcript_17804/g.42381 Transcript_17804/m.42381 type:complete len:419 (-) Transcript_17804:1782-3038(-)